MTQSNNKIYFKSHMMYAIYF